MAVLNKGQTVYNSAAEARHAGLKALHKHISVVRERVQNQLNLGLKQGLMVCYNYSSGLIYLTPRTSYYDPNLQLDTMGLAQWDYEDLVSLEEVLDLGDEELANHLFEDRSELINSRPVSPSLLNRNDYLHPEHLAQLGKLGMALRDEAKANRYPSPVFDGAMELLVALRPDQLSLPMLHMRTEYCVPFLTAETYKDNLVELIELGQDVAWVEVAHHFLDQVQAREFFLDLIERDPFDFVDGLHYLADQLKRAGYGDLAEVAMTKINSR